MENLRDVYKAVCDMSTKPDRTKFPKYRADFVIDEHESVIWNREQVQLANKRFEEEVIRLQKERQSAINSVKDQIYCYIRTNINTKFSHKQAILVYEQALKNGSRYELFNHIDDLIDFINNLVAARK